MPELIGITELPDRTVMAAGFIGPTGDSECAGRLAGLIKPFYGIAESGKYPLAAAKRLNKREIAEAIAAATRAKVGGVEYVSVSAPVLRLGWMSDDGYQRYRDIGFAQVIRMSTDPWLEVVLKNEYGLYIDGRRAEREAADDLFRASFGNTLHRAINGTLFSGAAYPVEVAFVHFIASVLSSDSAMIERMIPLIRLLPRAIPLGIRKGSDGVWNVLVA